VWSVVVSLLHSFRFVVQSRASLHLEIIALRHQLAVVHRSRRPRLRFTSADRILWAWLSHAWADWRSAIHIVKPQTVIVWHHRSFRLFWTWKSRHGTGRPGVPPDVRALIRELSTANPLWGAPRIHGELVKLGISVNSPTISVAEGVRVTRHRLDATRVPRSRHRGERRGAALSTHRVYHLLHAVTHAPGTGKERADLAADHAVVGRADRRDAARRRAPPPLRSRGRLRGRSTSSTTSLAVWSCTSRPKTLLIASRRGRPHLFG